MSISDKLLQINQVKQDIKTALENKGVDMTNVAFTDYANKILDISGGGGVVDEYFYYDYAKLYYTLTNNSTLFENAWTNHNKRTTLFDGNISFEATDDSSGMPLSFYSGVGVDELYDIFASGGVRKGEFLKITVNNTVYDATSIDSVMNTGVAVSYLDGESGIYSVGKDIFSLLLFIVLDATLLGMPYGKAIAFVSNENVNYLKIESGFNHYYENGIIIPDGVEIVPNSSYSGNTGSEVIDEYFENNDFPLTIPNSVTTIEDFAFYAWKSNNQPLVIPDSVMSIGESAFFNWKSNNQPLVIPNSVTSIGYNAFYSWESVPYVEIQAITPPTLVDSYAFWGQNQAPIYVPDESVDDYKSATNWVGIAYRIFSINDK